MTVIAPEPKPGPSRRTFVVGAAGTVVALVTSPALATPESMTIAMRDAFGETPIQAGKVAVSLPDITENGKSVSLTVEVDCPMTEADYVRSIHIFSEKNPLPDIARFHFTARSGKARVTTRIRLADSQTIVAVATMSDDTLWSGSAASIVTLAACIDLI